MMMMNVSHAAHKIKKMSKEQTPLEEANKWLENIDVKMWLQTVIDDINPKACLAEVLSEFAQQLLNKEKEQREKLIKEVCVECYRAGQDHENYDKMGLKPYGAEQYYNEVIKPKYKI